ncbi:RNA polymerase sigma factor ShbA [Micromonospora haikouensis]|uniref:RNA polymerase sigma factor ShbA n=1 Tax=Actinomycetes TaxID=1760 RepID=UPI0033D8BAEB
MTAPIDAQLVARAARSDPDATECLFASVRPRVLRYCRARLTGVTGSYHLVDDITQDVCVALINALPTYRDQGRPFSAFVYAVARRKIADVYDAATRAETAAGGDLPDQPDDHDGPERLAMAEDVRQRMRHLLDRLPPTEREIIVLRVALRMSAEDVGRTLGMSAGAVRVRQMRAMATLKRISRGHLSPGDLR